MHRSIASAFALGIILGGVTACGGSDAPKVEATVGSSSSQAAATGEPTVEPSETPVEDVVLDAAGIAAVLAGDVPSVQQVTVITEDNDPNDLIGRPNGYVSAAVLSDADGDQADPQPGVAWGATVELFEDDASAQARSDYIQGILEESPMFGTEYHYLNGSALLRVSGAIKPSVAAQYEASFAAIN